MRLSKKEALELFRHEDLLALGRMADASRAAFHPEGVVTFVIDRNINYTNVCLNRCLFCAFYRTAGDLDAYVLGRKELFKKIEETIDLGGTQILLQGGLNPALGIDFYLEMLRGIKRAFPSINIHGFSPPEITHIADITSLTIRETIEILKEAGLDSIPGGGAEILSDRVRKAVSPKKINSGQWLKVMREAHRLGMRTTATMMFGSVEKPRDIIEHLEHLRELQDETGGFTAFIPWSFQPGNTALSGIEPATGAEYLRVLSAARLYLDNFRNVQASWVTQGIGMAQVALRFGANDFGSTMIEENVVASAGVSHMISKEDIIGAVKQAGFRAAQRDTAYNIIRFF